MASRGQRVGRVRLGRVWFIDALCLMMDDKLGEMALMEHDRVVVGCFSSNGWSIYIHFVVS